MSLTRPQLNGLQDRKVIEALQREGDLLDKLRRVDHWMYFANQESRTSALDEATARGFEAIVLEQDEGSSEWGLQLHRADSVDLKDIHEVVIELTELAEQHEGKYGGWETSVERAANSRLDLSSACHVDHCLLSQPAR